MNICDHVSTIRNTDFVELYLKSGDSFKCDKCGEKVLTVGITNPIHSRFKQLERKEIPDDHCQCAWCVAKWHREKEEEALSKALEDAENDNMDLWATINPPEKWRDRCKRIEKELQELKAQLPKQEEG